MALKALSGQEEARALSEPELDKALKILSIPSLAR
jgi:hypothetical protein